MAEVVALRPETLDDVAGASALHVLAWQRGYAGILPDEYLAGLDVQEWAQRRRDRLTSPPEGTRNIVAEDAGQIVGFIVYGPDTVTETWEDESAEAARIWACYVHPDHWGRGVGGRLVTHALEDLPHSIIRLWVLEANGRARRLYERHGFRFDGVRDDYAPRDTEVRVSELRYALSRR